MKTKAVVFDAYGTLFDVNSAAEKCKDKIGVKWEIFANFWRTTQLEYTWLRSLMKRHKNFWDVTEDSLEKSMKVFNKLKENKIDTIIDNTEENFSSKMKKFNLIGVPYQILLGKKNK